MRGLARGADGIRILGPGSRSLFPGSRSLLGGIHYSQVVDGSTRQQLGRDGLIPTAMAYRLVHEGQMSVEDRNVGPKCQKVKFPELGLPGVENVPTPRGIILHLFPASQLPYSAKIQKIRDFGATPLTPPPIYRCGAALYRAGYPSLRNT